MAGSELKRVLMVDDESHILSSYRRGLRREFEIITAQSGQEALARIDEGEKFPVIISDYNMPGMNGDVFLKACIDKIPSSVRVLLSGKADIDNVLSCINNGQIFRFLLKPCSLQLMKDTIKACYKQYDLEQAEKVLLSQTLMGAVQILVDFLSLANPAVFGYVSRLKTYMDKIVGVLHLPTSWQYSVAVLLSHTGAVIGDPDKVQRLISEPVLTDEDKLNYRRISEVSARFIEKIPRLGNVAKIILRQHENLRALKENPDGDLVDLDEITIGAQLLSTVIAFDRLINSGVEKTEVLVQLYQKRNQYHHQIVDALDAIVVNKKKQIRSVHVDKLNTSMILAEKIVSHRGMLLISSGQELNHVVIERLKDLHGRMIIGDTVKVYDNDMLIRK